MKNLLTLVISFMCIIAVSCQSPQKKEINSQMQQKFGWTPGVGATFLYPMEIYRCHYIFADSTGTGPVADEIATKWGDESGISAVGEALEPVPVALDITWLSFTENKFYRGYFKLPYQQIFHLFKVGFDDYQWNEKDKRSFVHQTYDKIITGVAPGGVVVVWLSGSGFQTEVGRYQAQPTTVNMADFLDRDDIKMSKDDYVKQALSRKKEVTDNVAKNGIPFGLWDKYRERFTLKALPVYEQPATIKTANISFEFYNGEKDVLMEDRLKKINFAQSARIKEMRVVWTDSIANKSDGYSLDINFDEVEIFKAYKEVYGDNPYQAGELQVLISKNYRKQSVAGYRVFLKSGNKQVELLKQKGEIFYDPIKNK
ncbi:hypothetical protein ACVWYN_002231 [Pedobacter sp. UYP24]